MRETQKRPVRVLPPAGQLWGWAVILAAQPAAPSEPLCPHL